MSAESTAARLPSSTLDLDAPDGIRRALLAAIVESSDDAIVSKTLTGRILSWNAGATRIFGYRADEAIGKPITLIVPPELYEEERLILEKLRRGECIDHFDTTRLRKDGRRIPVSLTISPVRDAQGTIVGASKIARDISDRKGAETALRVSEQRLAAEVEALARLTEWSTRLWRSRSLIEGLDEMLAATIEMLGADMGNIQLLDDEQGVLRIITQRGFGQEFLDFFREVSSNDDTACGRSLRAGERVLIEDVSTDVGYEPYREAAQAAGYRAVLSAPLISAKGVALGVISAHFHSPRRPDDQALRRLDLYLRQASDFIERLRLEDGLRRTEEVLREADRRKDEFLALLAHELRNPLAPIRYALATTRKPGCTTVQRLHAEDVIERQVAHMGRLLDDLLVISRITHGTLELKRQNTDLKSIVAAAVETARPIIHAKRHVLAIDLPPGSVELHADATRLAQVFSNLLINAAKYTDAGGRIELRAVLQPERLLVTVRDNGPGISGEMMPRLFTLFSQAQAGSGNNDGLGIGLALVRGLTELHGGTVRAESAGLGRGSEFTVMLPYPSGRAAAVSPSVAPERGSNAALRVLVVDDSQDAADTCATLLELSGHAVCTAYTALRALELGERFHPQALLVDIGLPDLSGYELAQRIRAAPWGQHATLIAVTGWGQEQDKRRALEAGFDHHLTKPVAADAVTALLGSLPGCAAS